MLELYAHPFSSYWQKVLIALDEYGLEFELRTLSPEEPENTERLADLWPFCKFPLLVDDGRAVRETSIIIEYLTLHHAKGAPLIPANPKDALEVRFWDRCFDIYVAAPQQKIVFDAMRPEDDRDPAGVADARTMLTTAYGWLDAHMADRTWVADESFSLADCSAAPQLFYANWTHAIGPAFPNVTAYCRRNHSCHQIADFASQMAASVSPASHLLQFRVLWFADLALGGHRVPCDESNAPEPVRSDTDAGPAHTEAPCAEQKWRAGREEILRSRDFEPDASNPLLFTIRSEIISTVPGFILRDGP